MSASNIDIIGVGNKANPLPSSDNVQFESLNDYLTIAKKTISSYAPSIRSGLAQEMLANDDAIANIAHVIMMADWKYDGRGDRMGYRAQQIKYAIKSYATRSAKRRNKNLISLERTKMGGSEKTIRMSDTIADSRPNHVEEVSDREMELTRNEKLEGLLNSGIISDKQADYLRLYYLQGVSMPDIANRNGVSRQSVHDMIRRALIELKELALNDDFFRGIIVDAD